MSDIAHCKVWLTNLLQHFGKIPGIPVGTWWKYRVTCSEAGVHRPMVAGIHGTGKSNLSINPTFLTWEMLKLVHFLLFCLVVMKTMKIKAIPSFTLVPLHIVCEMRSEKWPQVAVEEIWRQETEDLLHKLLTKSWLKAIWVLQWTVLARKTPARSALWNRYLLVTVSHWITYCSLF